MHLCMKGRTAIGSTVRKKDFRQYFLTLLAGFLCIIQFEKKLCQVVDLLAFWTALANSKHSFVCQEQTHHVCVVDDTI